MQRNIYLTSLIILMSVLTALGQLNYAPQESGSQDTVRNLWDRFSIGGSASMSQQDPTRVSLSPNVEFQISELFKSGLNANLIFTQSEETEGTDLGLGLYGRLTPSKGLPFLQLEYQWAKQRMEGSTPEEETIIEGLRSSLLVGGGLDVELHEKLTLRATVMYDTRKKGVDNGAIGQGISMQSASMQSTPSDGTSMQSAPLGGTPWVFRIGMVTPLSFLKAPAKGKDLDGWFPDLKEVPFREGFIPIPGILKKMGAESNLSVTPGNPSTIDFSPLLTVDIDSNFSAGIGPSIRTKVGIGGTGHEERSFEERTDLGGRAYLRYRYNKLLPFLQLEYEGIYGSGDSLSWGEGNRKFVSSVLVGTGHSLKIKKVGEFGVTVLRNLSYRGATPVHSGPWTVRTSFKMDLPFDDIPIPGTYAPKKKGFRLSDILKLEGAFGLSLGELTKVDLSPALTHELNEHLSLGAGPVLKYQNDRRVDVSSMLYGGRTFVRLSPKENLPFLQIEGESMNISGAEVVTGTVHNLRDLGERNWHHSLLIGGGVRFPIGNAHYFNISALRDVTFKGRTPVRNEPWEIRMGLQL